MPKEKRSITVKEEGAAVSGEAGWYIDGLKKAEGKETEIDFSRFHEKEEHTILVLYKDGEEYRFSRDITENGAVAEAEENGDVKTGENFVSFRLTGTGEKVKASAAGEDAVQIEADRTYYVADITGGKRAYADTLKLETAGKNLEGVKVRFDTVKDEKFSVSELAGYVPEKISVKSRLNGRNYVYWDNKAEGREDISYNVYRSSEKDFEPAEENLAASGIKAGYYSEINANEGEDKDKGITYYAVTAVREEEESLMSAKAGSRNLDSSETTKRLGIADYWNYTEFGTATGTAYIEESEGNFAYSQSDMAFETDNLETGFSRTYNSKSDEKGAFGKGWMSSFDLQLLKVYDEDAEDNTNLVFRDGTGCIYRFIKERDKYISSQGEYMRLEEKEQSEEVKIKEEKKRIDSSYTLFTNDNIEYRFNSGGQLVYIGDPNGSFLVFEYQTDIGLLEKVTTEKGITIAFTYNSEDPEEDMLLVKKADMPDGSSRIYDYRKAGEEALLTKVTERAKNGDSIAYGYSYTSGNDPCLDKITDAEGDRTA